VCALVAVSTAALWPGMSPAAVTKISPAPTKNSVPVLAEVVTATAIGPRLFRSDVPDVNCTSTSTTIGSGGGLSSSVVWT
jgi:hypothetical protein